MSSTWTCERPLRRRGRWASVLIASILPAAAHAQGQIAGCELWAEVAATDVMPVRLEHVRATCGDAVVTADRAHADGDWLVATGDPVLLVSDTVEMSAAQLRLREGEVEAEGACLTRRRAGAVTCCGDRAILDGQREWTVQPAICTSESGARFSASAARFHGDDIALDGVTVGAPVPLPYPVGRVSHSGRAAGFLFPTLGYHQDRGAAIRQEWFQPFGDRVDATLGVIGETDGAVGGLGTLRLAHAERPPSDLEWMVVHDGDAEDSVRGAVNGDMTVRSQSDHIGVTAIGTFHSDAAIGPDFAGHTLGRVRADRHLTASAWVGSDSDRMFVGHARRASVPADSVRPADFAYVGSLASVGYATALSFDGLAGIEAHLRYDRFDSAGGGLSTEAVNRLRMLGGGQLRWLSLPGLSLFPGVWVDVGAGFADADNTSAYRQFDTRLLVTGNLSSSWVGGGADLYHLIELRGDVLVEALHHDDTERAEDAAGLDPPYGAPVQVEAQLAQSLRSGPWRLDAPVAWVYRGDDEQIGSRLIADLVLERSDRGFGVRVAQRGDFDADGGEFCCWSGALAFDFGAPAGGSAGAPPQSTRFRIGGYASLVRSRQTPLQGYRVPGLPDLAPSRGSPLAEGVSVGGTAIGIQWDWLGLDSAIDWPLDFDEDPDISGALSLGWAGDFRLVVQGARLGDGTFIGLATLAPGGGPVRGIWR